MLTVIPFFSGDKAQAVRLAEWIRTLGGVKSHDCLLAVYKDTDSAGVIEPLREAFNRVAEFSITDDMENDRTRYQYCANITWKRSAMHIAEMGEPQPWLWMEVDAVPLPTPEGTPSWLDQIAMDYQVAVAAGKAFLLDLVVTATSRHNSGVGVYPAFVRNYTRRLWELQNDPWDVFLAPDFMPATHHTELIHDMFWMRKDPDTEPTFPTAESLSIIQPGAVIFHRCKDGSLHARLREKASGNRMMDLDAGKSADDGPMTALPETPILNSASDDRETLLARIAELEAELESIRKPEVTRKTKSKPKRKMTPERRQQLVANLAKARAVRADQLVKA